MILPSPAISLTVCLLMISYLSSLFRKRYVAPLHSHVLLFLGFFFVLPSLWSLLLSTTFFFFDVTLLVWNLLVPLVKHLSFVFLTFSSFPLDVQSLLCFPPNSPPPTWAINFPSRWGFVSPFHLLKTVPPFRLTPETSLTLFWLLEFLHYLFPQRKFFFLLFPP